MPWHEPVARLDREIERLEKQIEEQINTHLQRIDDLLFRLQRELFLRWMFAVVGLVIVAVAIWFVALQAKHAAREARHAAQIVMVQRHDSILRNCEDQNARNANTINELHRVVVRYIQQHPSQKAQIKANAASNILLINALAPHQNCQQLVHQQAPAP